MADMEVSSDTGHNRPEDDEDLIEIDFDLPEDPSMHASNLNPNDDSDMADDYEGEAIDAADPPEPTEHTMEEANPLDDEIADVDYAIDENDEHNQEVQIPNDGEPQDLDLLDPDVDQDYEEHEMYEQTTLAPTNESNGTLASDADLARVIAYPIYVVYEGEKYPLLPSNTDEESQYSVLQSDAQVQSSLEDLFSACKDMLQEQADRLTLVLEFTSIGLTIDECSIYKTACSLYSILDVYIGLCENDAVSSGESEKTPLYIDLYTQPSFWSRFEQLRDGRQAGRGLTQYAYQADEDDASDGHALEQANGKTTQASQDQDESYDTEPKEDIEGAENDLQAGTHGPEGEMQKNLHDSETVQAQHIEDTNVAGEDVIKEETELGHNDNGDVGQEAAQASVDHEDEDEYYPEEQENYDPANDEGQYEPEEPNDLAQDDPSVTIVEQDHEVQENEEEEEEEEEEEQEEEDLIDYSDEDDEAEAENDADHNPEEPEDHSRDELHGDSTSFQNAHESHETLDGDGNHQEDEVQSSGDENVAHANATGDENAEDYLDEGRAVSTEIEVHPEAQDVDSQLDRDQIDTAEHDRSAVGDDGEDDIGFDLEGGVDDEADSEQTVGRTHDEEHHSAAEPAKPVEVESETIVDATHEQIVADSNANKANNVSPDDDEDDSWLTGYDEADEEHNSSAAKLAPRSTADFQDVDETSSIDSFSGETPSSAGRTQDTTLTSNPTLGTGNGTLLHAPAKAVSRKRSRSDLSDILDLDFESNVEAKKAKAA